MTDHVDHGALLDEWCDRLRQELGLPGLSVDIDAVLALAGQVAHAVARPAAPLTTFIVGYAAGRASAMGQETPDAAIETASATVRQLAQEQSH